MRVTSVDKASVNKRIEFVMGAFLFFAAIIILKLLFVQLVRYPHYAKKAKQMHMTTVEQQVGRGSILDCNGREMAISVKTDSICASPRHMKDKDKIEAANYLSQKIGMSRQEILNKLKGKKPFVYIKRKLDKSIGDTIDFSKIPGVYVKHEEKRFYPLKEVAAHLTGFAGFEGKGLEGVELQYEEQLKGKTGSVQVKRDAKQRIIGMDNVSIKKAEEGADIYLTIDSTMQYYAYREVAKAVEKYKARSGSAIIMDPNTGAILAMANYPSYDPNDVDRYSKAEIRNRAVTDMYEPGSTFKVFTIPRFLKEFPDAMNYKVYCENGTYKIGKRTIHDHEPRGWLTIPDVIKYSSNIGMVKLAMNIKKEDLYNDLSRFGFGKKTGIDLPGEADGMFAPVSKWDESTLTALPYGQEIAVTSVQMAAAYAAIANGGELVQPYVVAKIEKNGSVIYEKKPVKKGRVIAENERKKLIEMMESVMDKDGTGAKAKIPGFRIAGKTGTAQKHYEKGNGRGYAPGKYTTSFIAFLPADAPELLTLITIDEPRPPFYYASDVACPVFRAINQSVITYRNVAPQNSAVAQVLEDKKKKFVEKEGRTVMVIATPEPEITLKAMPDFYMKRAPEARTTLSDNNIKFKCYGFGNYVVSQEPKKGTRLKNSDTAVLYLGDRAKDDSQWIYMPNVKGLSIRKTIEVLGRYGLKVKCVGSGLAVSQDPKPGVAIQKGKECVVSFELRDAG